MPKVDTVFSSKSETWSMRDNMIQRRPSLCWKEERISIGPKSDHCLALSVSPALRACCETWLIVMRSRRMKIRQLLQKSSNLSLSYFTESCQTKQVAVAMRLLDAKLNQGKVRTVKLGILKFFIWIRQSSECRWQTCYMAFSLIRTQ